MSLSKPIEIQKSISDLPAEILRKTLFEQCFNIWERPILEQVCKQWKLLIPYNDSSLNVFCTYQKTTEITAEIQK
jgi:hypothetical protein